MRRDEAIRKLRALQPVLKRYRVTRLRIFGSVARDEATGRSDIGLIADFSVKPDLLEFIALKQDLADGLGVNVDLPMTEALRPEVKSRILDEAIDAIAA
ncbi:MAG TPA: nucleotidyltransferase family protein [Rhizomicrobium sp.]|nr:nucleotidyltransferase family protein [Rhizomicrobium sp.]